MAKHWQIPFREILWHTTWINATMYLATLPQVATSKAQANDNNPDSDIEYVSPEDELKYLQGLGEIK